MLTRLLPALLALAPAARAEVLHSRESALRLAFPDATDVRARNFFLSQAQKHEVESLAGGEVESRMVTCYAGTRAGEVLGYAFLDTHVVRSLSETILVLLGPDGRVRATHVLAFHEPSEYRAPPRWLGQFDGRALDPDLRLGRDVVGIAGSSLTSQAVTSAVRRVLALYDLLLGRALAKRRSDGGRV